MPQVEIARFTPKDGTRSGQTFSVQFNPSSLDYTITNTLEGAGGKRTAQYVSQSSGKLSMELLFDTTHSGEDVRAQTEKVAKLMEPGAAVGSRQRRPPARALFEWGEYKFEGIVESYREKIDFFSAEGVPLRATVTLTMSRQDKVFDSDKNDNANVGWNGLNNEDVVEAPMGAGDDAAKAARRAGDESAARDVAAANGFESIRSPGAAVVRLGPEVSLAPPVAFAAGASVSASFGIGLDVGAELDLGVGAAFGAAAGLDVDFSAGAGASLSADIRLAGSADAAGMAGVSLQASIDLGGTAVSPPAPGVSIPGMGAGVSVGVLASASAGAARGARGPSIVLPGARGAGAGRVPSPALAGAIGAGAPAGAGLVLLQSFAGVTGAVTSGQAGGVTQQGPMPGVTAAITTPQTPATNAGSGQERGVTSAGVPATAGAFSKLTQARGFRRHTRLDPESLVRSVDVEGYGTGASVGFRIGGQATMSGAASVAADVGQGLRLADRIRFDGERGGKDR